MHVPLAIVALCGFVLGGLFAIQHLRTREQRWDIRSYVAIHMSLIFGRRDADHRLDLGKGLMGALVGLERADARLVPDRVPAVRDLPAAALRDRGPRAPGALRVGVRDHRGRVRAAQLHRGARFDGVPASARARQHLEPPWPMALTFLVSLLGDGAAVRDPLQIRADRQAHARAAARAAPPLAGRGGARARRRARSAAPQRSAAARARRRPHARGGGAGHDARWRSPELPALPLHEAGKYVAGAYVVLFAIVLIYVAIMASA